MSRTMLWLPLLLAGLWSVPVASATPTPGSGAFQADGDYGSQILPNGDVLEDGKRCTYKSQGGGRPWEHISGPTFMGEQSYKVRVLPSPDSSNDRSEQKMLDGWSISDGRRYFTIAFYIPSSTHVATGEWLMLCQWWQDTTRNPPLSLKLGGSDDGSNDTVRLELAARNEDGPNGATPGGQYTQVFDGGNIAKNMWHYFMVRVDFGLEGTGSIALWKMDLEKGTWVNVVPEQSMTLGWEFLADNTTPARQIITWKVGTYRGAMDRTTRVYYDNLRQTPDKWNIATKRRTVGYRRAVVDLWYDDPPGAMAIDRSDSWNGGWGYQNHGQLSTGVSRIADCGLSGDCLYFNGVAGSVHVPVEEDTFDTGNYLSLSTWFGTPHSQAEKALVSIDRYTTTYKARLYWIDDDTISFAVRHPDNSVSEAQCDLGFSLSDDTWRHLAGTYNRFSGDGQRLKVYLNGVEVCSSPGSDKPLLRGEEGLYVGTLDENVFQGFIDETMMFNFELTSSEVHELAQCYLNDECR